MCESYKTVERFPLRKTPENHQKFPFKDTKYYTEPAADNVHANHSGVRMGYVAQLSLEFLEATGRKPDLENVPWLEAASNKGKR
jgi:hypothetical protein